MNNGTPIAGATSPTLVLANVTSPPSVYCAVTSGAITVNSSWSNSVICYTGPTVSMSVTNNGPSCRFINANITGDYSDIEWYQGQTGDTSIYYGHGVTPYIMVCPSSSTTFWCRVYSPDGTCNADSVTVTVP
jgi:hypothetical protein